MFGSSLGQHSLLQHFRRLLAHFRRLLAHFRRLLVHFRRLLTQTCSKTARKKRRRPCRVHARHCLFCQPTPKHPQTVCSCFGDSFQVVLDHCWTSFGPVSFTVFRWGGGGVQGVSHPASAAFALPSMHATWPTAFFPCLYVFFKPFSSSIASSYSGAGAGAFIDILPCSAGGV